jgi:rhamnulokinase
MATHIYLAFDLGAESGRAISGAWDGDKLALEQLHRFPNRPVRVHDSLHWDILALQANLEDGLMAHVARHGTDMRSLAIDTWGVDFALLHADDTLAGLPYHYRDRRTAGMIERAEEHLGREQIFTLTGLQFIEINTLYQLLAMRRAKASALDAARTLLMIPDLFNFWLSGVKTSEWTIASTTQMTDPRTHRWSQPLLDALDLPLDILPSIVEPGTVLGPLLRSVATRTGFGATAPQIVAPASHDTGSAIVAVPASTPHFGYISSGTWSLVGVEAREPVMGAQALRYNLTNEGGVENTYRVLKNISGLWLVQECRRAWARRGTEWSYADLTERAAKAPAFRSIIDPAHPSLVAPDDMPTAIGACCTSYGQPVPADPGAFVRCALESLALAYRQTFEQIAEVRGVAVDTIHVVGGGSQNRLLCQFTADACGVPVVAGPVEATALGNVLVQMIADGAIRDLLEAREVVRRSATPERFEPSNRDAWDDAYGRFRALADMTR